MNQKFNQAGFTIIELLLAMTFVSALLIMIALTTMQISSVYNRGLTLKTVNQSGRDVGDTLRRDVSAARKANVKYIARNPALASDLNRLCLGSYSYLWNYGQAINDKKAVYYRDSSGRVTNQPVRLARISDPSGRYCQEQPKGGYLNTISLDDASELLSGEGSQLVIHDLKFDLLASDSAVSEAVYRIRYRLGTNDKDVLTTSNQQCKPPTDDDSNLEFCAVNQFDMAVRASGV